VPGVAVWMWAFPGTKLSPFCFTTAVQLIVLLRGYALPICGSITLSL